MRKTTPGATTVYAAGLYERITHHDTGLVEHRSLVRSSERTIAVVTRLEPGSGDAATWSTTYLHTDPLGSLDVVTDEAGNVGPTGRRSYDAFGQRRDPTWATVGPPPPSTESQGFTGHEDDLELGYVNLQGRLYDPHLGLFLTPDPLVEAPWNPQSWNRYTYVFNNPLTFTDPSGYFHCTSDSERCLGSGASQPGTPVPTDPEAWAEPVKDHISTGGGDGEPPPPPPSPPPSSDTSPWAGGGGPSLVHDGGLLTLAPPPSPFGHWNPYTQAGRAGRDVFGNEVASPLGLLSPQQARIALGLVPGLNSVLKKTSLSYPRS